MRMRVKSWLVCVAVLVVMTGCQRKFTRDRFEMIRVGADGREDVRCLIGEPEADLGDQWFYETSNHYRSAMVFFDEAGRVSGKEWMDAEAGTWDGRNPHTDTPPEGEVRESETRTRRYDD